MTYKKEAAQHNQRHSRFGRKESRFWGTEEHEREEIRHANNNSDLKINSGATLATMKLSVFFSFYVVYFYEHE